jgi:hypothetical protein
VRKSRRKARKCAVGGKFHVARVESKVLVENVAVTLERFYSYSLEQVYYDLPMSWVWLRLETTALVNRLFVV